MLKLLQTRRSRLICPEERTSNIWSIIVVVGIDTYYGIPRGLRPYSQAWRPWDTVLRDFGSKPAERYEWTSIERMRGSRSALHRRCYSKQLLEHVWPEWTLYESGLTFEFVPRMMIGCFIIKWLFNIHHASLTSNLWLSSEVKSRKLFWRRLRNIRRVDPVGWGAEQKKRGWSFSSSTFVISFVFGSRCALIFFVIREFLSRTS